VLCKVQLVPLVLLPSLIKLDANEIVSMTVNFMGTKSEKNVTIRCDDAAMGEGEQFGRLPLSCRKKFRYTTKYLTKSP
jgi:hypothetical protein